jgi:hypothetical protein
MTLREAQQIAHGLIQGHVGPDHKIMGYAEFLRRARASATGSAPITNKDGRTALASLDQFSPNVRYGS